MNSACASFGLIGRTLEHSWSSQIHAKLSEIPYLLHELEPHELSRFIRDNKSWTGLNVTIPYKQAVMEFADELSPAAQRLGAVNTLVRRSDGSIYADNTDLAGFAYLLNRFCTQHLEGAAADVLYHKPVAVLGSGGASKAVCAVLEDVGALPRIVSRSGPYSYEHLITEGTDTYLVINTTPVGMYPNCCASPLSDEAFDALPQLSGVIDIIYNPYRTRLCMQAEARSIPTVSGLAMLVSQAQRSSELFQGITLGKSCIERIEKELIQTHLNICLIGMPGAGKTSTGRRVARKLGRPFVDMDDVFTIEFGVSPAHYIHAYGEDAFREQETSLLSRYGCKSGLVIACGGGVVCREANYELLHQNASIVMLDRPLDELSSRGRPLSQSKGIEALATERMPKYQQWADLVISCQGSASEDASLICSSLGYTEKHAEAQLPGDSR